MPIIFVAESAMVVTDDQLYDPAFWDTKVDWCTKTARTLRETPDADIGIEIFRPGYGHTTSG
jgi:hypothetical protein